jgi:glycosyltransferase involved in cell wall biosynthesis
MEKLKICIDARMINDSGIGTYMRSIIPYLIDKFSVTFMGDESKITSYLNTLEIAEYDKIIPFSPRIYSVSEQLMYPFLVPNCDIFWSPHYNVPFLPIKAKKRVVTIHDMNHMVRKESYSYFANKYAEIFMTKAVNKADAIITVSNFSGKEINRYFETGDRLRVIYNGIDKDHFKSVRDLQDSDAIKSRYNIPDNYLLYVGNIKPHKNIVGLLESYSVLRRKFKHDVVLLLVGRKEGFIQGQKDINDILEDLSLTEEKDVFFRSEIDHRSLHVIYSLAKVYLFLSYYEGFGLPVLEAQACGCPVISSNVASLPEVCGDSAVLVDPDDYIEIAYAIDTLLTDGAYRKKMIESGKKNIERFSWKKSAEEHVSVFKELF